MNRTLSALLALAFLAGAAPVVDAQSARQARQEVEASMLVTGHVDIDREGKVRGHAFDKPEKLPAHAVNLIERAIPALRFEPVLVDGAPVLARAKMSVRLVATPVGDSEGNMHVRIASAHFGEEYSDADRTSVRRSDLRPPRYPMNIAQIGGKGTVYLLVKVGRDGTPEDVVAEQVNLLARSCFWIGEPEMPVSDLRHASAARGSGKKADLHEVGFVDVLERNGFFADGCGERFKADRPSVIDLNDGFKHSAVDVVKA